MLFTTRWNIDELSIGTSPVEMFDFQIFRQILRSTSSIRKILSARLFQRWKLSGLFCRLFFWADYLPRLYAAHNSSKYKRSLNRHVTARNVRFSDFSPNSAVDVVETKSAIGQIVLALKGIKTAISDELFTTIVCCLQHDELLMKFVSSRHWAKCPIFLLFAYSAFDVVETKKDIKQIVLGLKLSNNFFKRIIYYGCLLIKTRRNIDELCIGTSPRELFDFRIFRQIW